MDIHNYRRTQISSQSLHQFWASRLKIHNPDHVCILYMYVYITGYRSTIDLNICLLPSLILKESLNVVCYSKQQACFWSEEMEVLINLKQTKTQVARASRCTRQLTFLSVDYCYYIHTAFRNDLLPPTITPETSLQDFIEILKRQLQTF